jgi:hypothetical protein
LLTNILMIVSNIPYGLCMICFSAKPHVGRLQKVNTTEPEVTPMRKLWTRLVKKLMKKCQVVKKVINLLCLMIDLKFL